jgi:hypothetical protein
MIFGKDYIDIIVYFLCDRINLRRGSTRYAAPTRKNRFREKFKAMADKKRSNDAT